MTASAVPSPLPETSARVAVGEDAGAVGQIGQQIGAVAGDLRAHLPVFSVDGAGFGEQ